MVSPAASPQMWRRSARGRLLPQAVIVCHRERSEASAERSRKTRCFRYDEKETAFPVRAANAQTCAPRSFTKSKGNPRLREAFGNVSLLLVKLLSRPLVVCHLERSEVSAERSRKTPMPFRSDEKQTEFPARAANPQICRPRSFTKLRAVHAFATRGRNAYLLCIRSKAQWGLSTSFGWRLTPLKMTD